MHFLGQACVYGAACTAPIIVRKHHVHAMLHTALATHKNLPQTTKSPFHYRCYATIINYITLRFWADAKAWGEGSENIFAKLDTISLELVSLLGLGPVQLDLAVIQHFAVVLKKLLLLLLLVVVIVVIVIADSRQTVLLVNSSSSNSSSRQVNKTWEGWRGHEMWFLRGCQAVPICKKGVKTSCNQQTN